MALTLLALSAFTYVLLYGVLHERADAALEELADTTVWVFVFAFFVFGPERAGSAQQPRFLSNDLRSWGRYIQIVDPQGHVLEKSDGLYTHQLPVGATALRRGLDGDTTFETISGLGEGSVRIVTVPVHLGTRVPLLVQAGASLEGVEAALQRAVWILVILTPSVFVLALVGGWLVVGRALLRVDLLTRTAVEIQSTNLQRRIEHAGPDDEIGRLARAFDQMIARLDQSFRQVRQFSADASHELKTPLTAIRGEAEVALMKQQSPAEYRATIGSILDSAERMSNIVDSLLLLARADAGATLIQREPVDLGEVTLAVFENLEATAHRHGVTLMIEELDDLTVGGDRLWLSQILTNLIGNAIKYTPGGGTVTIALRPDDGHAVLTVRDTGIGIAEEHLPRIFDRFYRVDHGRARTAGGAGLGLSITHWAVQELGGSIGVESRLGEGSCFRARFPLLADASDEARLPEHDLAAS